MDTVSRKTFNYKTRLFLMIMVFTWVITIAMFGIFYFREKEFKAESYNAHLQIYNAQLLYSLRDGLEAGKEYIDSINENVEKVRFTVLDASGIVIYDSEEGKPGEDYMLRNEISSAANNGSGFTLRRQSSVNKKSYFYSAMKGGEYIVRSSVPYDLTLIEELRGETAYLWTILVISIAMSLLAFYASRRFGVNVERLRDFAIKAEKGENPDPSAYNFLNDELGEISSHIIHLYNKNQTVAQERDCYYRNLLEEEKEKTRIKHQLTNNINHEIKTPVHAIQGCMETVLTNRDRLSKEQILMFVEKCQEQVKRLCALLNDISTITRISDASEQIARKDLDISEVIREVADEMQLQPEGRRMRVNLDVPQSMTINGNRGLLESIFRNLVSNSVAYSGGRDIFITLLNEDENKYTLSYSDNGIGVDNVHLGRIFERFYRVDDGRSRKIGGTGLGLSIVKNAVAFHGGDIRVHNRAGGGLEFVFSLNKR